MRGDLRQGSSEAVNAYQLFFLDIYRYFYIIIISQSKQISLFQAANLEGLAKSLLSERQDMEILERRPLIGEMSSFMKKPNPLRSGDGKSRISYCGEMAGLPERGDSAFFV